MAGAAVDEQGVGIEVMGEDETFRATVVAKLDALAAGQERLETRIEKDSDELYDRVRKLEIAMAVAKRDVALIGSALGALGGLVATGAAKLFGG